STCECRLELPGSEVDVRGGLVAPPSPEPPPLPRRPARCREAPVAPRRDDVYRRAHQCLLDGATPLERASEVVARESVDRLTEPDVGRRCVLRLKAADALEGPAERDPHPCEEQLACEKGAVQPSRRERHG